MAEKLIPRRSALKYFGMIGATAAGSEFLEKWLGSGAKLMASSPAMPQMGDMASAPTELSESPVDTQTPYVPRFLKPDEFRTVQVLTEIIIPSDDTPGAKEAKAADYIDFVVYSAGEHEPSFQQQWTSGLAQLDQLSRTKSGAPFLDSSPSQREALLTEMSAPEHNPELQHPGFEFYSLLKNMTLDAFFTSRVGLIDFLGYKGNAFRASFPGCTHPEHQS